NTRIKLMTDGILLAETQRDPELRAYDCLIIDEAHERSLNIDFLLGYLARLLPRRPDLKLIITSATIDLERFSAHFARRGEDGEPVPAPIVEVSGRTFPVSVEYLPLEVEGGVEQGLLAALEAIDRLERRGEAPPPYARDVLVFLPGERDIRDAAKVLRDAQPFRGAEVLPLYARLSNADQQRVFNPGGARRIVLSTNVAETSLTVPRIGYVIDSGLARISRYSYRSKLQRLPVEPISQASAAQRAGRCGRLAPGVCFRLFEAADFEARPAFTDPEIRRTNLASVVLRMKELDLGDPEAFPFLGRLTPVGRALAKLPVDPQLGRMLVAAEQGGVLEPVLAIVTALAQPDVRDRPPDKQQAADQAHAQWRDKRSDFLTLLALWRWLEAQREALSASAFRKALQRQFLSYLRVREWRALHRQLRLAVQGLGWRLGGEDAAPERIHQALLPGLLGQLGLRTERKDYLGARGLRFHIFPGSGVFGS
ncbi:MAG: ATP-dependent helicase, partial [Gammaproteobacteria bacterium]|nr:ATP-dependent helicase [Gammaproteobacteria bacterium]